jgi:hypothetical protein
MLELRYLLTVSTCVINKMLGSVDCRNRFLEIPDVILVFVLPVVWLKNVYKKIEQEHRLRACAGRGKIIWTKERGSCNVRSLYKTGTLKVLIIREGAAGCQKMKAGS